MEYKEMTHKEIILALMEGFILKVEDNSTITFDPENYPFTPFRLVSESFNIQLHGYWVGRPLKKIRLRPKDKQLCYFWNDNENEDCDRIVAFYNIEANGIFDENGYRTSIHYDNFEIILRKCYPIWAIKAEKILQD